MSHPSTDLYQTVKEFDRFLGKEYLRTLSLEEAALILKKIESFHVIASQMGEGNLDEIPLEGANAGEATPEKLSEIESLILVGCRLTTDLNEKILLRIMDIYQDKDHETEKLYRQLHQNLRDRTLSTGLLKKSQQIRNAAVETSQAIGLGVIL
ncbi:MAG: hypothetical protein K2X66_09185 [Cyanobacteria bacterium]|nr:hypothetical protein [Cyanobacteriota bacterium]